MGVSPNSACGGALAASGSVTSTGRGNKLERRADRRSRGDLMEAACAIG